MHQVWVREGAGTGRRGRLWCDPSWDTHFGLVRRDLRSEQAQRCSRGKCCRGDAGAIANLDVVARAWGSTLLVATSRANDREGLAGCDVDSD